MARVASLLVLGLAAVSALPTDPIILSRPDPGPRYQYVESGDGSIHLSDLWIKSSDLEESARFNPDLQNVYHLFTRQNPTVSQPLMTGVDGLLAITNYDARRRTIIIIHGWRDTATAPVNAVLVPAFLQAEDVNIVVVDWSSGAETINYAAAVSNTLTSGESVARFVNWLSRATGTTAKRYHILGHSLGGHQAGIAARNIDGDVAYVTGLDPAFPLWVTNSNKLRPGDSLYTEVIHTNAGLLGYIGTLGHTDFYPNGGINMPGCNSQECDHDRAFHYMAESVVRGGFNARRCATYITAMIGSCLLPGTLRMGGLVPKTGSSGIFHLTTRASPPFSRD